MYHGMTQMDLFEDGQTSSEGGHYRSQAKSFIVCINVGSNVRTTNGLSAVGAGAIYKFLRNTKSTTTLPCFFNNRYPDINA